MKNLRRLLLENKAWARSHSEVDPHYFELMAEEQNPEILWIGCSDSRVPPDEILNTKPGHIFTHRNIANLVYPNDENIMSVIEYAVAFLKVKYIVVCGHYGCGGVKAAAKGIDSPRLQKWTQGIAELKKEHQTQDLDQLVELNISKQVETLKQLPVVKKATEEGGEYPKVIGWVYDLKTGLIKQLD